jgi:HEPN domain-containing protein
MSAKDWLSKGKNHLEGAEVLIKNKQSANIGSSVGLLVWQGTEDCLKAVYKGQTIPRGHDLSKLINNIKASNRINDSELAIVTAAAGIITGSSTYSDTKYPEKNFGYWEKMPTTQLTSILYQAKNIYRICNEKVV